jgi:signal transduction histidine kinase
MTRRLILSYVTITVLVLVGLGVALEIEYTARERERVEADTRQDAHVLASLYEHALEVGEPTDDEPADEYRRRTGHDVVLVDHRGAIRVDTGSETGRDLTEHPDIRAALAGDVAAIRLPSPTGGADELHVTVPVASGGTVYGAVRITLDTAQLDARITRSRYALVVLSTVVLAVVALISWVIARSVTRPIRQLNAAAARFAAGDLATGTGPIDGPPEVRALGETMTMMAGRIDDLLRTQRRFVADASHQLRTPLTALRLRLENLQAALPEGSATQVDPAIDEMTRLGALVESLLRLTNADERRTAGAADLTALAATRVETWRAVADSAGVGLVADLPAEPVLVSADGDAVEQILDNLLDNAFRASPAGTTVTVRVDASGPMRTLTILDEGPGLSDDEKLLATQRFWRGIGSTTGTGLGLAIVESLALASGAELLLDDAPGGGLAVTVAFAPAGVVAAAPIAANR